MTLKRSKMPPNPIFGVILTHFCMDLVSSPCSFGAFGPHKTGKSDQMGPFWTKTWLSNVSYAARKCRQKCIIDHKNALCP